MYNRYIRGDNGVYTRISEEETRPPEGTPPPPGGAPEQPEQGPPPGQGAARQGPPPGPAPPFGGPGRTDGLTGFLRHMLDQLHLDHVDTGDLLLLALLFFLFREDADDELLAALGLLLIL